MLVTSKLLSGAGFAHAFPMRGTEDAELHGALGVGRVIQVKQVHGARAVLAATAEGEEADAIVGRGVGVDGKSQVLPRRGPRLAVGVRVADCVPVLVADEATGDVAAIHAGWRGLVAGVLRAGVELLGGRVLVAAIGPCIGACCFEVGREVAAQTGFVVREAEAKAWVDLRAAARAQLRALGVAEARIEDVPGCTKCDAGRFHSYRREGAGGGRMLAAIATKACFR